MFNFTVNLILAAESLAILGALMYSASKSESISEEPVRYSTVILSYFVTILFFLIRICLSGRPGTTVHYGLFAAATFEQIFCALSYPVLILYLYPAEKNRDINRLPDLMMIIIILLSVIVFVLSLINPFCGLLFRIDSSNTMQYGSLFYLPEIFTLLQMAVLTTMVFSTQQVKKIRIPVLIFFLIISSGVIGMYYNPDIFIIYPLSVLSLLLIYVNIIDQREQNLRHAQLELKKNRISLLMGQIQPHFVFNVLNIIYYLCESDQKSAAEAAAHLRMYLSSNFEERFSEEPIPFEKEIEIVRNYTDLEKLRFEQIEIIYDIHDTDFKIPALSVQPLVENAIRHGLREMREGRVIISSRNIDGVHVVEVTDSGIGWKGFSSSDNRRHVGIENVRRRLTMMSGASLEIFSPSEGGTVARIRIVK